MKFTDELNEYSKDIIEGYLKQDFLVELANGTLSKDKFKFYMIQDYLYLLEYSKIFALGIVKSNSEELLRMFSGSINAILNDEMDIHKIYMERLGITNDDIKNTPTAFINESYTSYMLDVANRGDILDVLIAVLSCAWTYEMIGSEINKIKGACDHEIFGEWVKGYSSVEYKSGNDKLIDIINEMAKNISQDRIKYLKNVYRSCCKHERNFWEMSYHMILE